MIDYDLVIGAAFILLLAIIIAGTFLLFPVSRKLGALLDANTKEKQAAAGTRVQELDEIRTRLASLEQQLGAGAERHAFLERLLLERQGGRELSGGAPAPEPADRRDGS